MWAGREESLKEIILRIEDLQLSDLAGRISRLSNNLWDWGISEGNKNFIRAAAGLKRSRW